MAKTLNHYRQQIRSLAGDANALQTAWSLGHVLIDAKAAVKAAGQLWGEWLQAECDLSERTARRFATIARRWEEPTFVAAREANPELPIREADKVLAASSTRKRPAPADTAIGPELRAYNQAKTRIAVINEELWQLQQQPMVSTVAGDQLKAAEAAMKQVFTAITKDGPPKG